MKNFVRTLMSFALVTIMLGVIVPVEPNFTAIASTNKSQDKEKKVKDTKVLRGPEVAARVKKWKEQNENVRVAFRAFEKNGRRPRIEDSESAIGTVVSETASHGVNNGRGTFLKTSFMPQGETISGDGYEITFVPSYSAVGEWQGTVIASKYDSYGNLIAQRTHNVLLSDTTYNGDWEIQFEVSYQAWR